jgi:hypothetical protein
VGVYLVPPTSLLDHPAAIIEAFAAQAEDLLGPVDEKEFWFAVDTAYYKVDAGGEAVAGASKSKEDKSIEYVKRVYDEAQLLRRITAFGAAMQSSITHLWKTDVEEQEEGSVLALPYPSTTAALGGFTRIATIRRLTAVFSLAAQDKDCTVGFWNLCEELDNVLSDCGVGHQEPEQLQGRALRYRLSFFTRVVERQSGSPSKKARRGAPTPSRLCVPQDRKAHNLFLFIEVVWSMSMIPSFSFSFLISDTVWVIRSDTRRLGACARGPEGRRETPGRRPCAQRGGSGVPADPPRSQTHTSPVLRNAIGKLLQLEGIPLTW